MPAKDFYHDAVVQALKSDRWKITHDPLTLAFGGKELYVDIGTERTLISAERDKQKIAVEVKSFLSNSLISELEKALGQYSIYKTLLSEIEPERQLYLAVPHRIYESLLTDKFGQLILNSLYVKVIVFDSKLKRIKKWIN